MANITLPATLILDAVNPRLSVPAQQNRSAWTGRSKILGLPGNEYWTADVAFRTLATETGIRAARAFFFALRGKVNTFDLPAIPRPQEGVDTTVSSGGAAGARTITLASAANVLPGKFMSITLPSGHRRLVVPISKAGNVVTFEPSMIESAAAAAVVSITLPVMRVRLSAPEFAYGDADGIVQFTATVEEAI